MSDQPGICLIINNKKFFNFETRIGSEKDVEMFETLFKKINYEVIIEEDLGHDQFLYVLEKISKQEKLKNYDIFVSIIMSHGVSDHVVTSDSEYISYDEILNCFSNEHCQHLIDKPKVFIFNCCRSQCGMLFGYLIDMINYFNDWKQITFSRKCSFG